MPSLLVDGSVLRRFCLFDIIETKGAFMNTSSVSAMDALIAELVHTFGIAPHWYQVPANRRDSAIWRHKVSDDWLFRAMQVPGIADADLRTLRDAISGTGFLSLAAALDFCKPYSSVAKDGAPEQPGLHALYARLAGAGSSSAATHHTGVVPAAPAAPSPQVEPEKPTTPMFNITAEEAMRLLEVGVSIMTRVGSPSLQKAGVAMDVGRAIYDVLVKPNVNSTNGTAPVQGQGTPK